VQEIFVVDAGSTDGTLEIATQAGARVLPHAFVSHARQWHWALQHLPLTAPWVLGLDADQRVTPALRQEMMQVLASAPGLAHAPAGYFLRRQQIFRGTWIRHGGYYPKYLLKLFRRDAVWVDPGERVDHHFRVCGKTARLRHDLIEDNRNEMDIAVWVAKHTRYAALQAQEELQNAGRHRQSSLWQALRGSPDDRVRWCKQLWGRLPLYVRPVLYFLYRYVGRLGFIDGKNGFIFHVLQAFWYRLLVDIKLDELRRQHASLHRSERVP
jgi:glycosyltransferase involved in cell wall biosynthesis